MLPPDALVMVPNDVVPPAEPMVMVISPAGTSYVSYVTYPLPPPPQYPYAQLAPPPMQNTLYFPATGMFSVPELVNRTIFPTTLGLTVTSAEEGATDADFNSAIAEEDNPEYAAIVPVKDMVLDDVVLTT